MNESQPEGGVKAVGVAMTTLAVSSVLTNVSISVVIVLTTQLRVQFNHVLTLSLFVLDALNSMFVMPVIIASYLHGSWSFGRTLCQAHGTLSSALATASIITLCAISIERCYSIHAPMHYAAHMTLFRIVAVILCIWIAALVIALLPLIGWNSYEFRIHRAQCSYAWDEERSYVIVLTVFSFALPGLIMVVMYSTIFKIARDTATQIAPVVSIPHLPTISRSVASKMTSGTPDSGFEVSSEVNQSESMFMDNAQTMTRVHEHRSHWKAAKILLSIICVFFAFWTPYFVVAMLGVKQKTAGELVVTWLGFTSHAINPILYGWMNRVIREGAIGCLDDLKKWCFRQSRDVDEGAVATENEDFFQFLERTSITRTVSVRCSRGQVLTHSPAITE